MLSLHPNKTDNPRAKDAFNIVQNAYQCVMDPQQRAIYHRIYKEAEEKTLWERKNKNLEREKKNLKPLPEEGFRDDVEMNVRVILREIEEKKELLHKMEESQKMQRKEKIQLLAMREQ